jgi:hypothetical protein
MDTSDSTKTSQQYCSLSIRMELIQDDLLVKSIISGADSKSKIFQEELRLSEYSMLLMDSLLQNAISNKLNPETLRILQEMKVLLPRQEALRIFTLSTPQRFFGIPYASIYDDAKRKTLDKALRDLSKRVNHGANYNMGWSVLIDTMGEDKIREAQKILNLPKLWSLRQVAEYLLAAFHKTYPKIAGVYYKEVISEVRLTSMLSSKALHGVAHQAVPGSPLVRYCFGKPWASKQDLNAYVAHPPQSLNAMTLNRAYMKVFYEIALHPDYSEHFKLGPQIHDSILFQFRKGHTHITELVKQAMEIPVTIKGYDKVTRTFTVPAAIKAGKDNEGARRWSETE